MSQGRPYIVAEIGGNHNGDVELGKRMIREAKECGADAVKFQLYRRCDLWTEDHLKELNDGSAAAKTPGAAKERSGQISLSDLGGDEVRDILCATDLNTITPIEAMNLLFELQKKARG